MIDIKINITNKIANAIGTPFIVCGNSDYTVTFTFDAEWGAYQEKTARFFFVSDGIEQYIDVLFSGNTCNAPVLPNIEKVLIGVYTGNLRTTTGAEVRCKRSILFGGKVHEPPTTEDVYNEILEIVSKKLGSEGGTVTGDYFKDGNTFIHEGNLDLLDNHFDNRSNITATATGSAITIESANAPLQNLKLYGKTEQDETPTPDAPVPLVSVGDSGSFNVGVFGNNLYNGGNLSFTQAQIVTLDCPLVAGTYTISCTLTTTDTRYGGAIVSFLEGGKNGANVHVSIEKDKRVTKTFTILSPVKYIRFHSSTSYGDSAGYDATYTDIMLNIGSSALPYEEYKGQILTLTDTLRGVGEVADEKDFAKGVTTQRVGFVTVLNYISSVVDLSNGNKGLVITIPNKIIKLRNALICSHAQEDKNNNPSFEEGTCYENTGNIVICGNSTDTLETLKAKYGEAVIQYELATPIETPLTETELNAYRQLMTNSGTTTVLSEADMTLDYYVNKPNAQAIGNIHSQVNADYFKLQQAIISLGVTE